MSMCLSPPVPSGIWRHVGKSGHSLSPTSAWWRTTMPLGSILLHSAVDLAVTPKPRGTSDMENRTTPVLLGVLSVILPTPDLRTWLPYSRDISAAGFTHTCSRQQKSLLHVGIVQSRAFWRSTRLARVLGMVGGLLACLQRMRVSTKEFRLKTESKGSHHQAS